jgi:hypothetical protein
MLTYFNKNGIELFSGARKAHSLLLVLPEID